MATIHNVFLRKYGDKAVLITVTDWQDFEKLEELLNGKDDGDFLLAGTTAKGLYDSNVVETSFNIDPAKCKNITDETKGDSYNGIMTGNSNAGPIWAIKKI